MSTRIIHYLYSVFVEAIGRGRHPDDLSLELRTDKGSVVLDFSAPVTQFLLLPDEAEQLAESLVQIAEEARNETTTEPENEQDQDRGTALSPKANDSKSG